MLDDLEVFRPGGNSVYRRVLIPTTLLQTGTTLPAWTYTVELAPGLYLPGGYWPAI